MSGDPGSESSDAGHVDLDELADVAAGVADQATVDRVTVHVSGCAQCQDRRAALDDVARALRAAPRPELPPDVAARLDAALHDASATTTLPTGTVVPLEPAARRRPSPRWAGLGAAAAAVALVGALVASHVVGGNSNSSGDTSSVTAAGASSGAQRPATAPELTSLEQVVTPGFTHDDLMARVSLQLRAPVGIPTGSSAAPPTTPGPSRPAANLQAGGSVRSVTSGAKVPAALAPLQATDRLRACITQLDTGTGTPLAVDYTTYRGKPAVIVVVPDQYDVHKASAYVVGPRCGKPNSDGDLVIYEGAIPR